MAPTSRKSLSDKFAHLSERWVPLTSALKVTILLRILRGVISTSIGKAIDELPFLQEQSLIWFGLPRRKYWCTDRGIDASFRLSNAQPLAIYAARKWM